MTPDYIVNRVRPSVSGCPTVLIDHAVNDAQRAFCRRTDLWRGELVPLSTKAGRDTVYLIPAEQGVIVRVLELYVDGRELATEIRPESASGPPRGYRRKDGDAVTLWPTPDDAYAITGRVSLQPAVGDAAPEWLLDDWFEAIQAGALYRLMSMPGRSWSQPQTAEYWRRQASQHANTAINDRIRGRTGQPLRAQMRPIA